MGYTCFSECFLLRLHLTKEYFVKEISQRQVYSQFFVYMFCSLQKKKTRMVTNIDWNYHSCESRRLLENVFVFARSSDSEHCRYSFKSESLSYQLWSNGFNYTSFCFLLASLQVWQHFDCMRLETEVEHYLCEQCDPRLVDRVRVSLGNSHECWTLVLNRFTSYGCKVYVTWVLLWA